MVSAWSLRNSARNISFTVAVSIFTEDFSLIERQVIVIKMKNKTAIISAKYPSRSISDALSPPASLPSVDTESTVMIVTMAEPTPAQERAIAERFSRSFPLSVKAGIMDQYGMSIIV